MKIIKQDLRTFWKPTLIYIITIQLLIYIGMTISEIDNQTNSIILEYFILFVIAMCYITSFVYTALFAIYYNTKSNINHRDEYHVTDGYGIYRFIMTMFFILLLTVNILGALQLNGVDIISIIAEMHYYDIAMVLFALIPILTLVIISIGHSHKRKLIRNIEAQVSIIAIFIGIYIAGNLYYFDNPQQGVAVLLITFIPLAILYMSLKSRNSQRRIYKNIIFIGCGAVVLTAIGLLATSEMKYNTTRATDQYEPVIESSTNPIQSQVFESKFGPILYISKDKEESTYDLGTDDYLYHWNSYGTDYDYFTAKQISGANYVTINMGTNQSESEVIIENYDLTAETLTTCTTTFKKIASSECKVDSEVLEVYQQIKSLDA